MKLSLELLKRFPLEVTLPGLPPSVNHTYARSRMGGVFKNKKARDWENIALIKIRTAARMLYGTHDLSQYKGLPLEVDFLFYRPTWRAKAGPNKGRLVRPDISNFLKISEDILCGGLGLDDSAVVHLGASKLEDKAMEIHTVLILRFI